MAITKPPVLPAWAEAGDKVQPSNAEIQAGWPLSSVPPSRQRFNWILNFVSNAVRYLLQRGLPEWSASEDYPIGARIQYGGLNYVSLTANTNKQPDTNTSDWEQWGYGDTAFQGRVDQLASFSVTTADVALTAAQAKAGILNVSGTLTGNCNIIIPNSSRRFVIINGTSGAYSLGVKTASGSAVTVAQGAATSVVCDGANNVKLASTDLSSYAPINSPALTGNPTAPTPAQFDNDTSIATTAFVRRESGNLSGVASIGATGTLLATDAGKGINVGCASANQTISLPDANSVPAGAAFYLYNQGFEFTLSRSGTDSLSADGSIKTSFVIPTGGIIEAISNGSNQWYVGGTGLLSEVGSFAKSLAASGYQKLPGGLIIQWGEVPDVTADGVQVVTFPIAFPSRVIGMLANLKSQVAATSPTSVYSASTSLSAGVVVRDVAGSPYATGPIFWIAIGY